jgi:hypothetical protein
VYFIAYEAACGAARRLSVIASLCAELHARVPLHLVLADGDAFAFDEVGQAFEDAAGQTRRWARLAFAHVAELL